MRNWIRFFVGTPQRFLGTLAALAVVVVVVEPSLLNVIASRLFQAVSPLLGPLIQVGILVFALRIIFRGFCGGGKR